MSSFHSARSNSSSCSDSSYGSREEPMMRLHGRRCEGLKLGNSCINIFSQIFHWNRSIGAAGHKYLSPRFHHSGKQDQVSLINALHHFLIWQAYSSDDDSLIRSLQDLKYHQGMAQMIASSRSMEAWNCPR